MWCGDFLLTKPYRWRVDTLSRWGSGVGGGDCGIERSDGVVGGWCGELTLTTGGVVG